MIEISDAAGKAETCAILQKKIAKLGFDIAIYSHVAGDHIDGIPGTYDIYLGPSVAGWGDHYTRNNYREIDHIRKSLSGKNGLRTWDEITASTNLSEEQSVFFNELQEANVHNGMSLSIHEANGNIAAVSFASSHNIGKIDQISLSNLTVMARMFHEKYASFNVADDTSPAITLSSREKSIMSWVAAGKTNVEIGMLLNLTEDGIKYHLKNIYKKLGVSNRSAATVKSIQKNLINP